MNKKIIHTSKAPQAIGPYSQAIKSGNFLFISGQIPINHLKGEIISQDIKEQTKQCLENIKAICESCQISLENILKTTIYLTDLEQFSIVNEIYAQFFPNEPPARVCVEVSRLPKDAQLEIEAIACFK